MSTITKAVAYGLFCCLMMIVSLEFLLRTIDPSGLMIDYDRAKIFNEVFTDDPRGVGYKPGVWQFIRWTMTVDKYGNRIIPDSDINGASVVFVGDSVTVGWGVNDNEAWVNLVSRDLHLNSTNRAVNGYNMQSILRTVQMERCTDCIIVWLMIGNDGNTEPKLGTVVNPPPLVLSLYLSPPHAYATMKAKTAPTDELFWTAFDIVATDERVRILAFDDALTKEALKRGYIVSIIPDYRNRISYVDPHPNVIGNQEIATVIEPLIETWLRR